MPFQQQVQGRNGQANATFDRLPDHCPVCLNGIQPVQTGSMPSWLKDVVELPLRCPRQDCERIFIARYRITGSNPSPLSVTLMECIPQTIIVATQSDIVKGISADFVNVIAQAERAEKLGLLLICGPGYRKALEFLIKDYVIPAHPDKADEIKKLNLAKCIADYVSSDKVKQVAARAVWLGNDETHYLRKWEDKDLRDLKGLIQLTVHWIEMEELTEAVLKDMPQGK